ncbi:ABC transporter substrate-binding protein [Gynuella sunshinyii]|uniref:ABC-type sugar transport system, periplasmic component n=1 Tax=Gynuella sunshinyii YC6258 TaxID=1445510 RepID=A0A0C5V387_9GAMM|nr:ABC transporter substrate-binding protein [Gynuella sunshinyii]AJQ94000.1 ABC-type sugar transport system, periplasmic component [Gynuella sunshinyii YC6258]
MKKTLIYAATCLATMVLFYGCSSGENAEQQKNNHKEAKKELVVWDWTDPYKKELAGPMDIVLEQYKKENPDVELKIEQINNDNMRTKLLAAVSANNLPDVAYLDGQWLSEFKDVGILADLTPFMTNWSGKTDFPKAVWDSVTFDGHTFGVPGDGDVRTLLYRKDLLAKAGYSHPPKTWSELVDVAQKIQKVGAEEGIEYGFALNGGNSEHTSMRSLPYIWDLGGDFIDAQGQPTLNSAPVLKTVQFLSDLVNQYKVAPPDSYLKTKREVAASIIGGQTAMAIVGSWEWRSDANFLAQANLKEKLGSAPIPVPDGVDPAKAATAVGYGTWVIFKDSDAKQAAWNWIEKVTSAQHEVNIFKDGTGNMPMRLSAYKDPVFTSDPIFSSFVDTMPNARSRPKTNNYELLSQSYRDAIQKVLSGKQKPKDALKEAQDKVKASWK